MGRHQLRSRFEYGDFNLVRQQSARRFESQKTATDDGRTPTALGVVRDPVTVVDRAEEKGAWTCEAIHRWDERSSAGGDDDVVVGRLDARGTFVTDGVSGIREGVLRKRGADHDAAFAIDAGGFHPCVERDPIVAIPRQRIHEDVRRSLTAIEHIAQEDAVVVAVGLGAEHHDLEAARCSLQDFLDHPGSRHAVTDNDQSFHRDAPPCA